jgi:hypothetical protein
VLFNEPASVMEFGIGAITLGACVLISQALARMNKSPFHKWKWRRNRP